MENQKEWKEMRRMLRMTRIFCILNALLTVGLFVVILFVLVKMQPVVNYVEETQSVMNKLSKLDVTALNKTARRLEKVDFEILADTVDTLDMDELNEMLEQVSTALANVDELSEIMEQKSITMEDVDVEALTTAIQNLSETIETLKSLDNKWGSFLGVTG